MATISLTIADTDLQRVVNDTCLFFGYQALLPQIVGDPIPNPETKAQFARRMIVETVKSWVKTVEMQQASTAAAVTAGTTADAVGVS